MAAYLNRLLIRMLEPYVVPDPHSHSEASDGSSSSSDSEEDDPDAGRKERACEKENGGDQGNQQSSKASDNEPRCVVVEEEGANCRGMCLCADAIFFSLS